MKWKFWEHEVGGLEAGQGGWLIFISEEAEGEPKRS